MAEDAPLLDLPLHLMSRVLHELGDVNDLGPAVLAHPFFYSAYRDCPSLPGDLVRHEIGDDEVFMLALAAHESKLAGRCPRRDSALRYLLTYRDGETELLNDYRLLSLAEAVEMSKVHKTVEAWTQEYSAQTLSRLYGLGKDSAGAGAAPRPSKEERRRIAKTMYRYQIECNLFGDVQRDEDYDGSLMQLFYDASTRVEIEQLGCVEHFFMTLLISSVGPLPSRIECDEMTHEFATLSNVVIDKSQNLRSGQFEIRDAQLQPQASNMVEGIGNQQAYVEASKGVSTTPDTPAQFTTDSSATVKLAETPASRHLANIDVDIPEMKDSNAATTSQVDVDQNSKFGTSLRMELQRLGYHMWDDARVQKEECQTRFAQAKRMLEKKPGAPDEAKKQSRSRRVQYRPRIKRTRRLHRTLTF